MKKKGKRVCVCVCVCVCVLLGRTNILLDFSISRRRDYNLTLVTPEAASGEVEVCV